LNLTRAEVDLAAGVTTISGSASVMYRVGVPQPHCNYMDRLLRQKSVTLRVYAHVIQEETVADTFARIKTATSNRKCQMTSGFVCAPGEIRTPNLLIRSQMLYPLSYGCLPGACSRATTKDSSGVRPIRPIGPAACC
jgi:hypothetical protein